MTQVGLKIWRELELRSSPGGLNEVALGELAQAASISPELVSGAISELVSTGAMAELSDPDVASIAAGQPVSGNLVLLALGGDQLQCFRVQLRDAVRMRLMASRELLRRRAEAMRVRTSVNLTDSQALRALESLGVDDELVSEAMKFSVREADWSLYGNMTPEFLAKCWGRLAGESRHERLRLLAVLVRLAHGGSTPSDLIAIQSEIGKLTETISQLSERTVSPNGIERTAIPKVVQHEVWRRDGGKCAQCGSQYNLEFDHIIPVSKGGSSTARNVQLLCEPCNRRKSDNI